VRLRFDPGPIKESPASGHLFRFAMGGAVTTCTGLLAKAAGPKVGGLFLALPAILPTGIAFMVKLQNKKVGPGARGDRARRAAVIETTGASAGGIGMIAFALIAWQFFDRWPVWLTLAVAIAGWAVTALVAWTVRKTRRASHRGVGGSVDLC
jgi:hypothetical protein